MNGNTYGGRTRGEDLDESTMSREKNNAATQEMFLNVFNSLRNYLLPPCEPRGRLMYSDYSETNLAQQKKQ